MKIQSYPCVRHPSFTLSLHSFAQIPVLWLTTAPVGDDATSLHSAPPRQYNQLPDLKFSFSPDNRITSRIIHRATEVSRLFSDLTVPTSSYPAHARGRHTIPRRACQLPPVRPSRLRTQTGHVGRLNNDAVSDWSIRVASTRPTNRTGTVTR